MNRENYHTPKEFIQAICDIETDAAFTPFDIELLRIRYQLTESETTLLSKALEKKMIREQVQKLRARIDKLNL